MKKKIQTTLLVVWIGIVAFTMPFCIASIYMSISGHAKGYGYDLGSENTIFIIYGVIQLIIWLLLAILPASALYRNYGGNKKIAVPIAVICFLLLFVAGVCILMGGWSGFFHYGFGL